MVASIRPAAGELHARSRLATRLTSDARAGATIRPVPPGQRKGAMKEPSEHEDDFFDLRWKSDQNADPA